MVCFQSLLHSYIKRLLKTYFSGDTPKTLSAITCFDPVSDSTPTAVVTEIDEDSAFTEARDNLRALLSQAKRHSVEMNASCSIGEEGGPSMRGYRCCWYAYGG